MPLSTNRDFINQELTTLLQIEKTKVYFNQCLKYMAVLSRNILKERVHFTKNEYDIMTLSAILNEGIWKSLYGIKTNHEIGLTPTFNFQSGAQLMEAEENDDCIEDPTLTKNYLIQFYINEPNFNNFLDLKLLQ